jgi:di/tricarboxylate transporter
MFLFGLLGSTTIFHLTSNISSTAAATATAAVAAAAADDMHKDCLVGWI